MHLITCISCGDKDDLMEILGEILFLLISSIISAFLVNVVSSYLEVD